MGQPVLRPTAESSLDVGNDPGISASEDLPADILSGRFVIRRGAPALEPNESEHMERDQLLDTLNVWPSVQDASREPLSPVVPIPHPRLSPYRLELLQQWRGVVTGIQESDFEARIADLSDPSKPDEIAVFSKEEVADSDLPLLMEGSVFYWSIGYRTATAGKQRVSEIVFLRIPGWSARQEETVTKAAADLRAAFSQAEVPDVVSSEGIPSGGNP